MKMPRTVKRYCPYCKAHTEQEVERVKKKEKPTKRINLRYRCTQCKKANVSPCIRAKKFELTE